MRKIVTKEILDKMVNDYHNGMDLNELSDKYKFQNQTIQRKFKELGIKITISKAKRFSDEELENIIVDYNSGMRPCDLAAKYDRQSTTIIEKLTKLGIYKKQKHYFTDGEISILKQYYPVGDWESINKYLPDISKSDIYTKMSKMGITMECHFWEKEEEDLLKQNYPSMFGKVKELVVLFNGKYTYSAICTKAQKLGLKTRDYWTTNEIDILKLCYSLFSIDELVNLLPNRSRDTIIVKASQLGLSKERKKYSEYEIDYIKKNAITMSDEDIAINLGRSDCSIQSKRMELGLSTPKQLPAYLDLKRYIRGRITKWKIDSLKNCDYKCILTGDSDIAIHHIRAFNLIFKELVETYKITVKENFSEYTLQELDYIANLFNSIQSKYPLGACIRKDLHGLFHSEYGQGNNTESQWNEFVENFKSGKYNYQINNMKVL